jgi:glutathione-specific gamma-glutamylcyclotransferase
LGVQDPEQLAKHIFNSRGPSGENKEYLLMLETALDDLGEDSTDQHITDLANRIRGLEGKSTRATNDAIHKELERIESGDAHGEQEEMETV